MALTLILGCMFSGKTTELIRMVERERSIGRDVVIINHSHDSERSGKTLLKTHSGMIRDVEYEVGILDDELVKNIYDKSPDTVAINEGQFFEDLQGFVMKMLNANINVIVCGLDSDFKRQPFYEIVNLIPHADTLVKTYALCSMCKNGTPALYSKRISGGNSRIQVGGKGSYIPVCRKCYGDDL
jgi:thymidine kinase